MDSFRRPYARDFGLTPDPGWRLSLPRTLPCHDAGNAAFGPPMPSRRPGEKSQRKAGAGGPLGHADSNADQAPNSAQAQ